MDYLVIISSESPRLLTAYRGLLAATSRAPRNSPGSRYLSDVDPAWNLPGKIKFIKNYLISRR